MAGSALVRVSLALAATGVVSAASQRTALSDVGPDVPFALAFLFFVALLVLAAPTAPPAWAVPVAFGCAAVTFVMTVLANGGAPFGIVVYVVAGLAAYLAGSPAARPLVVAVFALWTPAVRLFGPDPLGGAFPPLLVAASLIALAAGALALLDPRGLEPGERIHRVGLAVLAIAAAAVVFGRHLVVASSGLAPDDLAALIVAAAVALRVALPIRRAAYDAAITSLAIAAFALAGAALLLGKGYHVDAVTAPHRAAELLLQGEDPYRTFDLPQALAQFGLDPQLVTHYADGSVVRSYSYPALSFLLVAPFVGAGLADIRWIYLAELVVLAFVLLGAVRDRWRGLVIATVIGSSLVLRQSVLAGVDPTWGILAAVAWLFARARWLSPIAIGLAIADRQPAWFLAPFYLAMVWSTYGRREAFRRAAIAAVVALVPNLPFIVDAPAAFAANIATPVLGELPADGVGLVRFGLAGVTGLLPRAAYGALSALTLVVLLGLFWRYRRSLASAPGVFAFVPLYVAWRSLQNYFAFTPLLALAADPDVLARDPSITASERVPSTMPAPAAPGATGRSTAP